MPKKKHSKFHEKSGVMAKPVKKKKKQTISFHEPKPDKGWMIVGFDTSMSSLAGAAIAYDRILDRMKGPVFYTVRWTKADHYFTRLQMAAKSHELVLALQGQLLLSLPLDKIFIAQEEPWPFGMVKGADSGWLKQQAEISGAFLGGLVRYGFQNVTQMNTQRWRGMVANDLGITTHHSKWKDSNLPKGWLKKLGSDPRAGDVGKFRAKQWALALNHGLDSWGIWDEIPDWPDIIESTKLGKISRPEGSKAKAVQPEDAYDALAVCMTHFRELQDAELLTYTQV